MFEKYRTAAQVSAVLLCYLNVARWNCVWSSSEYVSLHTCCCIRRCARDFPVPLSLQLLQLSCCVYIQTIVHQRDRLAVQEYSQFLLVHEHCTAVVSQREPAEVECLAQAAVSWQGPAVLVPELAVNAHLTPTM